MFLFSATDRRLASRPIHGPHETGLSFRQATGSGIHLSIASKCWLNVLFKNTSIGFTKGGLIKSGSLDLKALHQPKTTKQHKGCLKKNYYACREMGK